MSAFAAEGLAQGVITLVGSLAGIGLAIMVAFAKKENHIDTGSDVTQSLVELQEPICADSGVLSC